MADRESLRWVGTWATTPSATEGIALDGQTVRMIAHISIGGHTLRVRLSNVYGMRNLDIGAANVALRGEGADIVPGSDRTLTFNGHPSATIGPGALVVSDPVELEAPPLADVAVSIYLPGNLPENFQITGHGNARQTNYISTPGDFTATVSLPVLDPRFSYRGEDVVATLERMCRWLSYPKTIRVDQGSEFVSRDMDLWAYQKGVTLDFSRPGNPTDNAFIEAFNGRFRIECPNAHWFMSLADAREKLEDWRRYYNE